MPLLKRLLEICLCRRGPQDLPDSTFLLGLLTGLNVLVSFGLAGLETDLLQALLQALLAPAVMALFMLGLLSVSKRRHRFMQTFTAGIGCDALITALALPLVLVSLLLPDIRAVAGLLLLGLLVWELAVIGHILRQALDLSFMAGLGLALVYTVFNYRIMMTLFPPLT